MSKCAKIICTYFGNRRTHVYNNPKDMTSFFLKMMKNEVNIDMGIETDVILVNNDAMINRIPVSEDNQFIVNIRQFPRLLDAIESRETPPFKSQILDKAVIDINDMNMKNKKIK